MRTKSLETKRGCTGEGKQLVGDEDGRVVLVLVRCVQPPFSQKLLHGEQIYRAAKMCRVNMLVDAWELAACWRDTRARGALQARRRRGVTLVVASSRCLAGRGTRRHVFRISFLGTFSRAAFCLGLENTYSSMY